ncbi:SDR family oxidoreductase, partial [Acinetobacter baumannii]
VNAAALQALQPLAAPGQLRTEVLDVRDPEAWQRVADAVAADWGHIDVLANVAGVLRDNWVHDATADDVHFHFDINVKGVIFG